VARLKGERPAGLDFRRPRIALFNASVDAGVLRSTYRDALIISDNAHDLLNVYRSITAIHVGSQ